MNARALQLAGPAGTEAIALNTSGLYIGIAQAGAIGGGALNLAGGVAVLIAASGIGLINLVFMTVAVRRYPSEARTEQRSLPSNTAAPGPGKRNQS